MIIQININNRTNNSNINNLHNKIKIKLYKNLKLRIRLVPKVLPCPKYKKRQKNSQVHFVLKIKNKVKTLKIHKIIYCRKIRKINNNLAKT
jgi:hypothetical protein